MGIAFTLRGEPLAKLKSHKPKNPSTSWRSAAIAYSHDQRGGI